MLLLCDGGGSNSARHYIFKYHLERLERLDLDHTFSRAAPLLDDGVHPLGERLRDGLEIDF